MKGLLIALLLAGCSVGAYPLEDSDAPPIKLPTGETSAGCNGLTEAGTCDAGVAKYCDVANDYITQVDCRALGQECVIDTVRGATCTVLENAGVNTPGAPCDGLLDGAGYCSASGSAVWCDQASDQIVSWDCGGDGLSCGVDQCDDGARCCGGGTQEPQPTECDTLGFYGECAGDTARYCTGGDNLVELDCAAQGKVCALDVCAEGAYCCDAQQQEPDPVNDCASIGNYGECGGPNGNTLRYCVGDDLTEVECTGGNTCMTDICFNGADCCSQAEYVAACVSMNFYGRCGGADGNDVLWCDAQGEIQRQECGAMGLTCAVDDCGYGAQCC